MEDLIRRKNPAEPIRIWVAGCSTGEEAYSISILLHEILGDSINKRSVQIFASDIDEVALRNGRKASFDAEALKAIDKNLIAKYFTHTEQKYQLIKSCRSLVLFSKHDLTFHPPFVRMDLISCRNLLIYFNRELQDKVIAIFNQSLNDKGLLFLGKSESIGYHKDSFLLLNEKSKLFSKKFPLPKRSSPVKLEKFKPTPKLIRSVANDPSILEALQNSFYEFFEHPHVLVNEKMDMVQVRGEIAPYIGIGQGEMTRSLVKNAHPKLQLELRVILSRCISDNKKVSGQLNAFHSGKQKEFVRIIAWPIKALSKQNRLFVVSFEKANPADFPFNFSKRGDKIVNADNLRIQFLEDELAHTKENLQAFIEEVETSNEELQSLSEEVQSANEELQAANEELETSNEELQSANEEMALSFNELREVHRLLEEKDALMLSAHYKLQAIMDNSLQGYLLIDNKYIIVSLNNAASQIVPMFSKEVLKVGDSFINAMPANSIAVFKENFDKAWGGQMTMRDIQLSPEATLNGKEIWLHVRYAPVYGSNGKVEHVLISYYDISVEINAQRELKNKEAKFRALSENSKDMKTIHSTDGSILYSSPSVSNLLGYSPEELTELTVSDLIHPEDVETFVEKISSILPAPGKTFNNEHRILHKNGEWLWCEATITNMIHEPEIRGFVSNFRNITERMTAQLALSKSEAFSRGVLDSLSSHIAVVDKTGLIIEVNKAWNNFAKNNGSIQMDRTCKGSNYFDVCKKAISESDETAAQALKGMLEVLNKTKEIFYLEYPCHTETEQRWFGMRVLAFENDDSMIVVDHRDITDRKVAESEIKYKANLLDMVEQAIITTDLRGFVTYWNRAAENTYEWKAEYAKGKNITHIIPNVRNLGEARKIILELKTGQSLSGEFFTFKKNGEQFPVSFTNSPIYNESGEITGVISVSRNITNRKKREAEREKMIQDLIYRNKNMEQFSYIISHNLRSPVANILGLTDLIKISDFNLAESLEIFSGISASAHKLDEVVKDLNEVLTLKTSTFEQKEYVYFQTIVEDVMHTLDPVIKKGNVRIETDFFESDRLLSVKSYILSIFYNLINNSIKYNKPDTNPSIKIKSKKTAGGLQLIFKDNGLGIDLKKQGETVFGLYKRFHLHKEGKGMGLFMVKTQTETLGGKVSIKSEVNKGTEFILEFNTTEA
jgi:two-component system CheB/CheR fusion protein